MTRQLLTGILALTLMFPLGRLVICVDVGGQAELEVAHGSDEHHHELVAHDAAPSPSSGDHAELAVEASHILVDSHDCHDERVSVTSAPNLPTKQRLATPPSCVLMAAVWPVAARPTFAPRAVRAVRGQGPPLHHVITTVIALI